MVIFFFFFPKNWDAKAKIFNTGYRLCHRVSRPLTRSLALSSRSRIVIMLPHLQSPASFAVEFQSKSVIVFYSLFWHRPDSHFPYQASSVFLICFAVEHIWVFFLFFINSWPISLSVSYACLESTDMCYLKLKKASEFVHVWLVD